MKLVCTSDFRELVQVARDAGWTVEMTKGSHWRFVPRDKGQQILIVSGSPSNVNWCLRQLRRDLKVRGLSV